MPLKPGEKILYHKEPIALIRSFKGGRRLSLLNDKSSLHKNKAKLTLTEDKLAIEINTNTRPFENAIGVQQHSFVVKTKQKPFVLKNLFINHQQMHRSSGSVSELYSKGYQHKRAYFYRLIIPLKKEVHLHYCLDHYLFVTDLGYTSNAATEVISGNEKFAVCICHDDKKQYYLCIESSQKQSFEFFSKKAFCIQCELAFLTGRFSGGVNCYFAYTKSSMKSFSQFRIVETRKSFGSVYQPVYINAYALPSVGAATQKNWYNSNKLKRLSIEQFSLLFEKLFKSHELVVAILLMVQSMASSMEQLPGGMAIVLEMLPGIIGKDLGISSENIQDATLASNLITSLKNTLANYVHELDPKIFRKLNSRIDDFNKISNQDKLKAPFEKLGIALSKQDLLVINSRNNFLHGNIPNILNQKGHRTTVRKTKDAYYCGVRLYTLISMLLLKWVGFDSYVVNMPVIHRNIHLVPIKEKPYRKV